MEIEPAAGLDCSFAGGQEGRRSLGCKELWAPDPDAPIGSSGLEPELSCIRLRRVG